MFQPEWPRKLRTSATKLTFCMRRRRLLIGLGTLAAAALITLVVYAADGYLAARNDAPLLARRADLLIGQGRGAEALGPHRIEQLLLVEDPGFASHSGVDLFTKGAGLTTMTQSLGKRVGFKRFRPGISKIRLIGYAMGLEEDLTKAQIVALWLDTVHMGNGPDGWMTGFFEASRTIYGRPPHLLSDTEFLSLAAVPIAPATFDLRQPNAALRSRLGRIQRLVAGQCEPEGQRDVWLEGCAT